MWYIKKSGASVGGAFSKVDDVRNSRYRQQLRRGRQEEKRTRLFGADWRGNFSRENDVSGTNGSISASTTMIDGFL